MSWPLIFILWLFVIFSAIMIMTAIMAVPAYKQFFAGAIKQMPDAALRRAVAWLGVKFAAFVVAAIVISALKRDSIIFAIVVALAAAFTAPVVPILVEIRRRARRASA